MADFLNAVTIRRSDLDDSELIEDLIRGDVHREAAKRLYGVDISITNFIETSYLSVTALDPDGSIIAFAVFDDYPPGLRSNDGKHENYWEPWYNLARGVNDELNSHNTLWLKFHVIGEAEPEIQNEIFVKILQSAYYSLPIIRGTMFLARGEAQPEDYQITGFDYIKDKFEELDLHRREQLSEVRGVHFNTIFYYSDRRMIIPQLEIRIAREEDHDDLAAIFNSQSDITTDVYGDYYIAELIAQQSPQLKSFTAQVNEKAVGMLTVKSDIVINDLWPCFELDPYDNLLDPEYMDIVREKRNQIIEKRAIEAQERARQEAKRQREETMICNMIAQRMSLQEYLLIKQEQIFAELDGIINNEDNYQAMDRKAVQGLIDGWLDNFVIQQPSEYFLDHPSDDTTLVCNILSESEFFFDCLEFFGLPEGYMNGEGHFTNWYRKKEEELKQSQAAKGATYGKQRGGKRDAKKVRAQEELKLPDIPEHFDLEPLMKALRSFVDANSESRTRFRNEVKKNLAKLEYCFRKEDGTVDKNLVNINTTNFSVHLEKGGFSFDNALGNVIGPMLRCFGNLMTRNEQKVYQPPQPAEEEKKATKFQRGRGRGQQEKEQKVQLSQEVECGVIVEHQKNKEGQVLPAYVTYMKTSYNDVIRSLDIIEDFDKTLYQLQMVSGEELRKEAENLDRENINSRQRSSEAGMSRQASMMRQSGENFEIERKLSTQHASDEDEMNFESDKELLYKEAVAELDDLNSIPDPPEIAKNAFCLVLYCIDEAFDSFGIEFLETAFAQFPSRDYMIITQPHTVPENSLMKFFTPIPKKPSNTYSHVLYVMHRDCLMFRHIQVRRTDHSDLENMDHLLSTLENTNEVLEKVKLSLEEKADCPYVSFTALCKSEIIGLFVLSIDVNLRYYQSHFHIEEHMLLNEHKRESHTRLLHEVINPIFLRCQNLMIRDVMRLMNKSCMYFEIHDMTVIPDIFNDLLYARSRKFPHFLDKPWDHEKALTNETDGLANQDGADRKYQDEKESDFALCFITKKHLSEPKIVVNHRIVVVGASDAGISFIESLLSNMYLQFNNIYLLAPGGLSYYHIKNESQNMKASSTSYSLSEMIRLLLESRVTVIDGRLIEIDREHKQIILHDDSKLMYDILILTMGLQDSTLQQMGRVSRGIAPIPENKIYTDGVLSIDDPYLYQHFRPEGNLMAILNHRKQPGTTVIYGYTLNAFAFIQGLLSKGINPIRIKLVVPHAVFEPDDSLDPHFGGDENILINHPAFENDPNVEKRMREELKKLNIQAYYGATLLNINTDDKSNLQSITISYNEEEITVNCKVLVTAGRVDVDDEIFGAIHNNGLVFNGRVIVSNQFLTTDPSIYAAGTLCEFSQQFRSLSAGRCLRMDRYNGREIGVRLARSVLSMIELDSLQGLFEDLKDEMPYFYMPRGKGGMLPGNFHYYYIEAPKYAEPKSVKNNPKNREDVISDTIHTDEEGNIKGHYIRFTFNNFGLVDSVTYFSKDSVEVQSLWRFVGLSETYLNKLSQRFKNSLIPDVAEFLSENWAMALYHDWFAEFSNGVKGDLKQSVAEIIEKVKEMADKGEELTREQVQKLKAMVPKEAKRMVQESTLRYIKSNLNHLPMYYIPGVEFP